VITCTHLPNRHLCDNCNRGTPMALRYAFLVTDPWDKENREAEYGALILCEDCSAAMGRLHVSVMEQGKPHKYDMDEITEVKP